MPTLKDVEYVTIALDPNHAHCLNQVNIRKLQNGQLAAIYNEERYPFHHDTGQSVVVRSNDGGRTWDYANRQVVLPYSQVEGNWDCGLAQLQDGTLMVNLTISAFFKRGIKPEQPSWASMPLTDEFGDWTWAYRLRSWLGTFVLKSTDDGKTWTPPIPVNIRPLKHGGCRLGAWQQPDGGILLGVYGRIHQYGEEDPMESTRAVLVRSDDGGDNWEYYSTVAYDPADIIDYDEQAMVRLKDGRLVSMLRTHINPSGDQKTLAMVVSEDEGFTWTTPKYTKLWGYPAELINLQDGRVLIVYGYRRPPYGTRGCISEDGIIWDPKNEFVIREGGVPGKDEILATGTGSRPGRRGTGNVNWEHPGIYQHIGYPSACQLDDGTIVCAYHEWTSEAEPIQYVLCTRFNLAD